MNFLLSFNTVMLGKYFTLKIFRRNLLRIFILLVLASGARYTPVYAQNQKVADSLNALIRENLRAKPINAKQLATNAQALKKLISISPDSVQKWSGQMREIYVEKGEPSQALYMDILASYSLHNSGKLISAEKVWQKLLLKAIQLKNDTLRAHVLIGSGSTKNQLGKIGEALAAVLEALKIYLDVGHYAGAGRAATTLASIHLALDETTEALNYVDKGLAIMENEPDTSILLSLLHTKANALGQSGRIEEALAIDKKGLAVATKTNHLIAQSQFYNNMALCYLEQGKLDLAEKNFEECLAIDLIIGNKKQIGDSYLCLGKLFTKKKEFRTAADYYLEAKKLSLESSYLLGVYESTELMANNLLQQGQANEAYHMLQQAQQLKDSLDNEKVQGKVEELYALYNTEQKEKIIAKQKADIKLNRILLFLASMIILLGAYIVFEYSRRRKLRHKVRANRALNKLQQQNMMAVVAAEEAERRRIALELHDGVGQLLSAAKLNLSSNQEATSGAIKPSQLTRAVQLIDEATNEVRAISHGLSSGISPFQDIESIARSLSTHLADSGLHFHFNIAAHAAMKPGSLIVLYRIVQEAIQNIVKHSQATDVYFSTSVIDEEFSMMIEDNGTGLVKTENPGIGMRNMSERAKLLKGRIEIDAREGKGTIVNIVIPTKSLLAAHA